MIPALFVQRLTRLTATLFCGIVLIFLLLPLIAVVISSFSTSGALSFPPRGFTLHWYRNISPGYLEAVKVSLIVAIGSTAVATLAGFPAALALVRGTFPFRQLISTFCLSPLMVPTLVIGVAAFQFSVLLWDLAGVAFDGTLWGLIFAQSAFTLPFVIRSVIAAQAHFDGSLEEAAFSLGARPAEVMRRVTLPLLLPGVASGAIFAFVMSFDDIAVPLFIGGGDVMTLPLKIYTSVEFNFDPDIMAVSALVNLASLILLILVDRLTGLERIATGSGR